jgi:hypothetical protein
MESTQTISAPDFLAQEMASSDFPLPVGPAITLQRRTQGNALSFSLNIKRT